MVIIFNNRLSKQGKIGKTGQYVSFSAFVETGNFRERFLDYIKEKLQL
jgi:hypothetical protein